MKLFKLLRRWRGNGDLTHARKERQHSEQELERTQREVIGPLYDLGDRNHFAEIIARDIRRRGHV